MKNKHYWIDLAKNRPYVPKRDLFRQLKYNTYNLLELFEMEPHMIPWEEFTLEEQGLYDEWESVQNCRMYDPESYDQIMLEQIELDIRAIEEQ